MGQWDHGDLVCHAFIYPGPPQYTSVSATGRDSVTCSYDYVACASYPVFKAPPATAQNSAGPGMNGGSTGRIRALKSPEERGGGRPLSSLTGRSPYFEAGPPTYSARMATDAGRMNGGSTGQIRALGTRRTGRNGAYSSFEPV